LIDFDNNSTNNPDSDIIFAGIYAGVLKKELKIHRIVDAGVS